jgi:hypothetical protein
VEYPVAKVSIANRVVWINHMTIFKGSSVYLILLIKEKIEKGCAKKKTGLL